MEEEKTDIERLIRIHDKYIEELEKQNEKLREMLSELQEEVDVLRKENEDLKRNQNKNGDIFKERPSFPKTVPYVPLQKTDGWKRTGGSGEVATWSNSTTLSAAPKSFSTPSAEDIVKLKERVDTIIKESEKFSKNYYSRNRNG